MGKKIPENVEIEPQRQGTKNMEISSPSFVCKGCYTESLCSSLDPEDRGAGTRRSPWPPKVPPMNKSLPASTTKEEWDDPRRQACGREQE